MRIKWLVIGFIALISLSSYADYNSLRVVVKNLDPKFIVAQPVQLTIKNDGAQSQVLSSKNVSCTKDNIADKYKRCTIVFSGPQFDSLQKNLNYTFTIDIAPNQSKPGQTNFAKKSLDFNGRSFYTRTVDLNNFLLVDVDYKTQ